MTKSTTDHIVYDSTDSEFRCRHCEDKSVVQDGATAELCLMRLRGFLLMHKLCQPKAVPSPQLALPHTERPRVPGTEGGYDDEPDCDPPVNAAAAAHGHAMNQHAPSPDYSSGPDWYDAFCREWPVARDHEQLRAQVSLALQGVAVPSRETMASWHPDSGIFQGIANWARTELAYMNARSRPGITPTLPQREEMPAVLVEARAPLLAAIDKPAKKKRTRKAAPGVSITER